MEEGGRKAEAGRVGCWFERSAPFSRSMQEATIDVICGSCSAAYRFYPLERAWLSFTRPTRRLQAVTPSPRPELGVLHMLPAFERLRVVHTADSCLCMYKTVSCPAISDAGRLCVGNLFFLAALRVRGCLNKASGSWGTWRIGDSPSGVQCLDSLLTPTYSRLSTSLD